VRGLRKVFRQKGSGIAVVAIERLDFTVRRGEIVAIVGKTGCGKSTFFNILMGLEQPSEGSIEIDGRTPYGDFDAFRGRIGIIFQQDRLLPWRSLLDNVTLGLEIMGLDPAERRARAERWLHRLGLDGFLRAFPNELSGGMRQRAALARAFAEDRGMPVDAAARVPSAVALAVLGRALRAREDRLTIRQLLRHTRRPAPVSDGHPRIVFAACQARHFEVVEPPEG